MEFYVEDEQDSLLYESNYGKEEDNSRGSFKLADNLM